MTENQRIRIRLTIEVHTTSTSSTSSTNEELYQFASYYEYQLNHYVRLYRTTKSQLTCTDFNVPGSGIQPFYIPQQIEHQYGCIRLRNSNDIKMPEYSSVYFYLNHDFVYAYITRE